MGSVEGAEVEVGRVDALLLALVGNLYARFGIGDGIEIDRIFAARPVRVFSLCGKLLDLGSYGVLLGVPIAFR